MRSLPFIDILQAFDLEELISLPSLLLKINGIMAISWEKQ